MSNDHSLHFNAREVAAEGSDGRIDSASWNQGELFFRRPACRYYEQTAAT